MKIVHIAPSAPYNDYWGYQENLLPKYQKKLGHEVVIITTNLIHKDSTIVEIEPSDYTLNDGIRVIRLKPKRYSKFRFLSRKLDRKLEVFDLLKEIKPGFIFYHGLVSSTINDVVKYKKEEGNNCVIVQDNHLDYNIGATNDSIKGRIKNWFYRRMNKKTLPYVEKVYGVTPWRKQYAKEIYNVPKEKLDVLIMGADDEKIKFSQKSQIRNEIRKKYNVLDNEFLIVTGGKIDEKKNIHLLIEACKTIKKVKLLVFGSIENDIKSVIEKTLNEEFLIYVGWIPSDAVYDYFFAADLVVFPGQHSVLWEQACASKVPCLFKKWEGMDHVDNGGNSEFVSPVTVQTLRDKIEELLFSEKYYDMREKALSNMTDIYLYSNIAKKSLECVEKNQGGSL
ncbi:MAG: glycosyltransferase family 4 protein [Clostridia bacterium]|nr:glycosyltransferase family 4 protein [Clostridia bacterium]